MRWLKWARLTGVLLFLWILSKIDWKTVLQTIKTLKPGYLAAYVLCFACMILVRVIRLRLCARKLGVPLSLPDSYVTTVEPALMGAVTPGRVGELTRIGHLQRHGMALPSALALVGIGIRKLSMAAGSLAAVRRAVRGVDESRVREEALAALGDASAAAVRARFQALVGGRDGG